MRKRTRAEFALYVLGCILPLLPGLSSFAQSPRVMENFDQDWAFIKADPASAEQATFDDAAWRRLSVPHDWAIEGVPVKDAPEGQAGGYFPTGIGWYRKRFTLPAADAARHVSIVFDGVMANSDVWINGYHLGHRPYGYVTFYYDLTGHLNFGAGATNVIAVRADNSKQPASRWYAGAGIYRNVRLVLMNDLHTKPWSLVVRTPQVAQDHAEIHLQTTVMNEGSRPKRAAVHFVVTAPDGQVYKVASGPAQSIAANGELTYQADVTIAQPALWDVDHPALYRAQAEVVAERKTVDQDAVSFGVREFHFDADTGFWLNGRNLKIKGAAIHEDMGALGMAVPAAAYVRRLQELRDLGVNAIRTAHNPPSPEFLDVADRMGFLVMDELFDCWTVGKNPYDYHLYFKEWSHRDEQDTVQRDRNHPSIILWSAGNEIHDTPQQALAHEILAELVKTFHENDPTRPVTQALFRPNASHDYDNGLADLLDVVGQNYRENELLAAHAQKPTRKILGTENGMDRAVWMAMRDHPAYSGQFLWAGADYLGESGGWPRIGFGAGLIDRTGLAYARSYERQSWWSDKPNVHIVRRIGKSEQAAIDPGYEATPPRFQQVLFRDWTPHNQAAHSEDVEVYTNADEVDLQLNGKSLGMQQRHADASPLTWKVGYAPGTLTAVAYTQGKQVASDVLRTAGKPVAIRLNPERTSVSADPEDVVYVDADVVDDAGTVVPDATERLHFSVTGPARIVGVDNGGGVDHDPFQADNRRVSEGHSILILRGTQPGAVTVTASGDGLQGATAGLRVTPAMAQGVQRSF